MADPRLVIEHATQVYHELDKMWGAARLGLLLVAAFFQEKPIGTDELADKAEMSTETVRRKIKPLWNVGRVDAIRDGRNVSYVATKPWAELTVAMIEQHVSGAGFVETLSAE